MLQALCTLCGFEFGYTIRKCIQSITCGWFHCFLVKTWVHKLLCYNPNIGFATKYQVQRPMKPKECVQIWNTFSQMGENARDGAQWLPSAFPLWELHSCGSRERSKSWLERQTSTKSSPKTPLERRWNIDA
jgi:hypothetical protein